jgi:hypothetical protein
MVAAKRGSDGNISRQSPCHSSQFPIVTFSAIITPIYRLPANTSLNSDAGDKAACAG